MLEETALTANLLPFSAPCLSRRGLVVARLCKLLQPPGQRDEATSAALSGTTRLCPCESPADCQSSLGRMQQTLDRYYDQSIRSAEQSSCSSKIASQSHG